MTNSGTSSDFTPQLRLHRLSWLFALTSSIRQMIIPLVAVLAFGARNDASAIAPMVFPLIIAALLVRAVWRQWIFRYGFGPSGLVIHDGLFFRNVRQIEYARIENIDSERGLLHRLLGVAEVTVQTSTGGKPEASISVLDLEALRSMREQVFADPAEAVREVDEAHPPLLKLSVGELVRYGLIDNRGMFIVAAIGGLLYELGLFNVNREIIAAWLASSSIAGLAALGTLIQFLLVLCAIVSALLIVRVLSVALAIVTWFDFTLSRHDADLRARYGLFTRVALTLRTPRIQAVHQTQSLLHRWFRRVSLNVDLTGDHGGNEQQRNGARARTRWLAPVCRIEDAPALISAALPRVDFSAQPEWRTLAPGSRSRIFRRTFILWVLFTIGPALWYLQEGAVAVMLLGAPLAWMHAHLYVKHTAWALLPDAVLYRRGWLTRRLAVAPRDRVQSVSMKSSPFDRRWGMTTVFVDTAGGSALTGEIRIRYLDRYAARGLMRDLYRSEQRTADSASRSGQRTADSE